MIADSLRMEVRKIAEHCGPFRRILLVNPPMSEIVRACVDSGLEKVRGPMSFIIRTGKTRAAAQHV